MDTVESKHDRKIRVFISSTPKEMQTKRDDLQHYMGFNIMQYDIFVSCSRRDDKQGRISALEGLYERLSKGE